MKKRSGRGRPKGFDQAEVLENAMRVFWEDGYEGASLTALQEATRLSPPSIYHSFGSKEGLYRACLDHYQGRHGSPVDAMRAEPPGPEGLRRLLSTAAAEYTSPDQPAGCMISTAALTVGPQHDAVAGQVAARRATSLGLVRDYLAQARRRGTLPESADPAALARYFGAIMQGMSVQARDGATREELEAIADIAMAAWPVE
ncbi:TetR family transcriptional regulator [Stackebrandtia albiflava]|uniref:TetR family transcriptional regulator n=1 Tax=Stackebrandtia albiflava TaxID=406432 RepID=A0A562UY37_9ACTN|nr:TetR/AcrR family transcriptional regulator [Stackebrandtia albiflava]TWJ10478.1 TetR family transcriptional regulator [Stackebrandtia albiflava]